jgi:hypothetical protein
MPNLPKQPKPRNKESIRQAWVDEYTAARHARAAGDTTGEWHHLERAHILSQPLPVTHVRTHVAMLGNGIRRRDRREILGQLVRLVGAGPGSVVGRYPLGNTGGADVNAVTPMPIPADLQAVLDGTDTASS